MPNYPKNFIFSRCKKFSIMQAIGNSELIITPRGSIYHIDLKQDEMAETIITVGDPGRVAAVSKHFDSIEFKTQHREFVTHTGYIGKKRLTVISSGIGPDNIDIVLNELDAVANIDFESRIIKPTHTALKIIRLGTSGSLQEDIPVDSLVAASHGIGLDNVLHYYQFQNTEEELDLQSAFTKHVGLNQTNIIPYAIEGSRNLLSNFPDAYHKGITVTCPGFYAPQGRVVKAALRFPELVDKLSTFPYPGLRVTNFEMETSAIYGLGRVFNHDCLSINTIVANRVAKTFSKDAATAIENMITKSLAIIERI
jgi:uridine phosphorylase